MKAEMVPAEGFCILLERVREEKRSTKSFSRTVGKYMCYWNGAEVSGLSGQIVERGGPGDNTATVGKKKHLRIREGTYRLCIQDGLFYKTFGYSRGMLLPKPGILLNGTGERDAILIHPGFDYLLSTGCLNPGCGLKDADSRLEFKDSRARVIALIETMKANLGAQFPSRGGAIIPGAVIVIRGEPVET
jgi:hypothetical protein